MDGIFDGNHGHVGVSGNEHSVSGNASISHDCGNGVSVSGSATVNHTFGGGTSTTFGGSFNWSPESSSSFVIGPGVGLIGGLSEQ